MRDEAARLLHSLTVKLTETFPALRQAGEEGKKKKKDLAVCPTQSIDDKQHVDTVLPFIHGVKNHYSGCVVGKQWHIQTDRFPV